MHHPMEKLVFVSYSLTQLVTSTPLRPVGKPDSISAGTGITYPGGYNIPASSDIRSIMRKIANYDTPLLEGDCSPVEVPSAIKVVPDTPEAFQSFKGWRNTANRAKTPEEYTLKYPNMDTVVDSTQARFIGGTALTKYDPKSCAQFCNEYEREECQSFNLFVERVPTLNINRTDCPNPPGQGVFICNIFSDVIDKEPMIGSVYWADFKIIAAGSNVYNKLEGQDDDKLHKRDCNGAPVIRNGGFEVDDPGRAVVPEGWELSDIIGPISFGLTKPGSSNDGGTYAFVANLHQTPTAVNSTGFVLSQKLNTCAGQPYEVSLDYRFDDAAKNQCQFSVGVSAGNDVALLYASLSQDIEAIRPHEWLRVKATYKSTTPHDRLFISVHCHGTVGNSYSIDIVDVKPVGVPSKA